MPLGANKAAMMGVAGVSTGDVVLLNTLTADADTSIAFTSGITSTYGEYIFKWYLINPSAINAYFKFQVSTDGGSSYGLDITSTALPTYNLEDGSAAALNYETVSDLANGTADQTIAISIDNDADANAAGELHIFNPSSTTYVKHFYSRCSVYTNGATDYAQDCLTAGYVNTTSDIDAVIFRMDTGNFDGTIKMWGVT